MKDAKKGKSYIYLNLKFTLNSWILKQAVHNTILSWLFSSTVKVHMLLLNPLHFWKLAMITDIVNKSPDMFSIYFSSWYQFQNKFHITRNM